MSQSHSPLWIYGGGQVRLIVRSSPALRVRLSVDGRLVAERTIGRLRVLSLPLGRPRWHLVAFDTRLVQVAGRLQGARLVAYALG